jgi:hypothetical protein
MKVSVATCEEGGEDLKACGAGAVEEEGCGHFFRYSIVGWGSVGSLCVDEGI